MGSEKSQADLTTSGLRFLLWWLPIASILLMQLAIGLDWLAPERWLFNGTWAIALLVMGSACLANAMHCNRVHCWFTGPYMLLMGLVMLLSLFHLLPGDPAPGMLANVAGLGTLVLWLVPELILGRYFGR
ncbi:MAG: hypothetical protein R3270_09430 [Gammaproteobacteria bacterium]|nr:hypothetical protein [Gammaproteobacteria bacterium]